MSSRCSEIDQRHNVDHELDDELPVVHIADVIVSDAAGMVNDERNVQQTH